MIDYKLFVENSRKWLEDYISSNRLQSLVLGISGGLDSCISACLASSVCKKLGIPLIGRCLITNTNKNEEIEAARQIGNAFCSDFKELNITYDTELIAEHFEISDGEMSKLQKGNIKARYRMIYLYHIASLNKGVVIDNDNFTEYNLGFYTQHGDQGDINLGLHYLWKTEIYELAEYLKEYYCNGYIDSKNNPDDEIEVTEDRFNKYEAIRDSINLTPTDGNGVSKSDCDQFGLENYEQVDDVLKTMYYRTDWDALMEEDKEIQNEEYTRLINSYNEQGVDKVMTLHQNTAYKRQELPIKPNKEILGLA